MRRGLAEFLGTFALVFAGTGAIVVNQVQSGVVTHPGIAAVFGLVVAAMIHTFGDVSGAHLNPAVTLAFTASGRFPARQVPLYLAAQILGAIAASVLLSHLFPGTKTLGETLPAGSAQQSFTFEVVLTLVLMLVILQVSTGAREKGITAGIAIGATVRSDGSCPQTSTTHPVPGGGATGASSSSEATTRVRSVVADESTAQSTPSHRGTVQLSRLSESWMRSDARTCCSSVERTRRIPSSC